jgi:molybdopterin synthase catalytic subunit
MSVTVLLFASIAEKAGLRKVEVASEPGDRVCDVRDRLLVTYPQLAPFVPTLMYALDEEYARDDDPVPAGATLALIPPVSGG